MGHDLKPKDEAEIDAMLSDLLKSMHGLSEGRGLAELEVMVAIAEFQAKTRSRNGKSRLH